MVDARKEILDKLKKASLLKTISKEPDFSEPVYFPVEGNLAEIFKQNLESIKGEAYIFEDEEQMFQALKSLIDKNHWKAIYCREKAWLEKMDSNDVPVIVCNTPPEDIEVGITGCEYLIAHTASVMVSSKQGIGRQMFVYPPVHIVLANENQFVDYLETAYDNIIEKYKEQIPSLISLITGPSRTADIEKTLVLGAHGPKELYVFITKH